MGDASVEGMRVEVDMGDDDRTWWEQYQQLQQGLADAYERSSRAATELGERYSAESFAASGSDDPMTRSYLAWLSYQGELASIAYDDWRSVADYRRAASTLLLDGEEAATTSMYQKYRDDLDGLLAGVGSPGSGTSTESGSKAGSEKGTAARRRRTRTRSSSAEH
jgi:hypothetical protein